MLGGNGNEGSITPQRYVVALLPNLDKAELVTQYFVEFSAFNRPKTRQGFALGSASYGCSELLTSFRSQNRQM